MEDRIIELPRDEQLRIFIDRSAAGGPPSVPKEYRPVGESIGFCIEPRGNTEPDECRLPRDRAEVSECLCQLLKFMDDMIAEKERKTPQHILAYDELLKREHCRK